MASVNPKDLLSGAGSGAATGAMFGPWGAAIGGLAGGIGSLIGDLTSSSPDYNEIYGKISIPQVQELIAAGKLGPSAMEGVAADPQAMAAQRAALAQLSGIASAGGLDPQSVAAQEQALQRSAQQDAALRHAALQQMAMRGQYNSGAGLAAQLAGQQQSAQANALAGTQAASDARTRALQAMGQVGQLGGQIQGMNWDQTAQKAAAQDAINRFNSQNARSAYDQNMGWQFQKAQGQMGGAEAQQQRDVARGGATGQVLGGAAGSALELSRGSGASGAGTQAAASPSDWTQNNLNRRNFNLGWGQ